MVFYLSEKFKKMFADNGLCRQFIEASPDAIIISDMDGVVLAGNSQAAQLFGYSAGNLIPQYVNEHYRRAEDREQIIASLSAGDAAHEVEAEMFGRDGGVFWANISSSVMDLSGYKIFISIVRNISERRQTEAILRESEKIARLNEIRFQKLYSLAGMADANLRQLYDFALDAAVKITDSEIGYIYFLNEKGSELSLYAWSRNVVAQCSVGSAPDSYHVADVGVWGEAVRQRRPVIINDYECCKGKIGLPEGHVPIRRHMNVPFFDGDKIVLLIGVGNKKDKYGDEDTRQLTLLMEGVWNIVRRKHGDEALRKAYAEMESKVEERTRELKNALGELEQANVAMAKEVGQRRDAELRLRQFERLVEVSPYMVSLIDSNYQYVMVNDSYRKYFNKPKSYFIGKPVSEIVGSGRFSSDTQSRIDRAFEGETTGFEAWFDLPLMGKRYFSVTYHPVESTVANERLVSVTAHDITSQKNMLEEVKRLASTDYLTGANNRRCFMDRAESELDRLTRYGGELYLMMLDIDHFKNVNDSYGHSVGDFVLQELVRCCASTLRTSDIFGRLGGEEFAALLVNGSVESATQVAERLRQAVEELEVQAGDKVVKFTVSIGLTVVCVGDDMETALKHADHSLYQAKALGRNRVVSYCFTAD